MTAESWAPASFSEKYTCPLGWTRRLEISPLTQQGAMPPSSSAFTRRVNSVTVSGRAPGPASPRSIDAGGIALADGLDCDRGDHDQAHPPQGQLEVAVEYPLAEDDGPDRPRKDADPGDDHVGAERHLGQPEEVALHEERGAGRQPDGDGHREGVFPRHPWDLVVVALRDPREERPQGVAGEPVGERQVDGDGGHRRGDHAAECHHGGEDLASRDREDAERRRERRQDGASGEESQRAHAADDRHPPLLRGPVVHAPQDEDGAHGPRNSDDRQRHDRQLPLPSGFVGRHGASLPVPSMDRQELADGPHLVSARMAARGPLSLPALSSAPNKEVSPARDPSRRVILIGLPALLALAYALGHLGWYLGTPLGR